MPELDELSDFELEGGSGGGSHPSGSDAGGGEGDRRALQAFLSNLEFDLETMLAGPMFQSDGVQTLALSAYDAGPRGDIERMIEMLDHPECERGLAVHGLLGLQLQFKLTAYGYARERYLLAQTPISRAASNGEAYSDQAAEEYLKCSDIILESLSAALGGAGGAVMEIKKMIEWLKGVAGRFGWKL